MHISIIGAGPAGLTAAYQLTKRGVDVDVYEAGSHPGGMARTVSLWGQRVDLGPHRFFSTDPRVNELWLEVADGAYSMVDRLTRIYYGGKFFHYPLRPFDALHNLGFKEAIRCVASYATRYFAKRPAHDQDDNMEYWIVSRFGRRLFEIFFKTYSEKLWDLPCTEMDKDFATQRIRDLSLWGVVKNALLAGRGNKHRTLVDQFAYPDGGTGAIYERMVERIRERGGRVHFGAPVERVCMSNGRATGLELKDGTTITSDHVISTMPLTHLVRSLPDVPSSVTEAVDALKFRNTILVYLNVDDSCVFPDNWLYIHSSELKTGRITNFRNWSPTLNGDSKTTILCLEYWCNQDDPIWQEADFDLIARARREIHETGLIGDADIHDGFIQRVPRCYPVYRRGYKKTLEPIVTHLQNIPGLTPIGRYGSFKYNNQDHSILMGILAAANVTDGAGHDLWAVNCDDEYQEHALITETGLSRGN